MCLLVRCRLPWHDTSSVAGPKLAQLPLYSFIDYGRILLVKLRVEVASILSIF